MKILIAEDDPVYLGVLEDSLGKWGYDVVATGDGESAWRALQGADPPHLALLDWKIPGIDGFEVCRRVRTTPTAQPTYLILLTAKKGKRNLVAGLKSGADDYLTKPFNSDELQARLAVGARIVDLQCKLERQILELRDALAHINQLQGILPICCYCKKIRNDQNYWQQVEAYLSEHAEVHFSHGICPDCYAQQVEALMEKSTAAVV